MAKWTYQATEEQNINFAPSFAAIQWMYKTQSKWFDAVLFFCKLQTKKTRSNSFMFISFMSFNLCIQLLSEWAYHYIDMMNF